MSGRWKALLSAAPRHPQRIMCPSSLRRGGALVERAEASERLSSELEENLTRHAEGRAA